MKTIYPKTAVAFALLTFTAGGAAAQDVQGDASKGKSVFKRCAACHVVDKKQNRVGPHLVGIVGRPLGAVEKYRYSKSLMKKAEEGVVWNKENLDAYLKKPKDFIPRGKMAFAGLRKEKDRANVIAYLEEAGKEE